MISAHRFWVAALAVLAYASLGTAHADVTQADEYLRRLKIYQTVQPLGPAPFGEQVNLYTGELTFSQTDISLEGTGPTISLVRDLPSFQSKDMVKRPSLLGDWLLSIPRIETLTHSEINPLVPGQAWVMGPASHPDRYKRCTLLGQPFSPQALDSTWWNGIELVTETGQRQPILHRTAQYLQQPSISLQGNPVAFTGVTLQNWQIGCLPATSNGELGEAFLAVSPEGTKYWFDYLTDEAVDTLYEFDSIDGTLLKQRRRLATMYVSKIEDRFGNWVSYQYSGDKPVSITASDGRSVEIKWRIDARLVDQILVQSGVNQRVWRYEYSTITPSKATLSAAVLPDTTRWTFDLHGILDKPPLTNEMDDCGSRDQTNSNSGIGPLSTLTHPSGLVGKFTVSTVWHARSYVPSSCVYPQVGQEFEPYESNLPFFGTNSLVRKELAGPGLAAQVWTYTYASANGSTTEDPCVATDTCLATTWVDVVDPQGDRTRYTHSNRWNETEGKLLSTQSYQGATTLLGSESLSYAPSNLGPYPTRVGSAMTDPYSNYVKDEVWTPLKQRSIAQQDAAFT